jgi:GTP-binding protein
LRKALEARLPAIAVVNKIDRQDARPEEVVNEIYELFIDLDASDDQLDFPIIYTNAKTGVAHRKIGDSSTNLQPLFDEIVASIPAPSGDPAATLQIQVTNLDYSDFLGRIAIARVFQGTLVRGTEVGIAKLDGKILPTKITKLFTFRGLERDEAEEVKAGDIVAIAGVEGIQIGETITDLVNPAPLDPLNIDEPTLTMVFTINTSPFAGREGQYVTSRQINERLERELLGNVAIRVEETASPDQFKVSGRGELQLAILIEMMRREGYELQVSKPEVITRRVNGELQEPIEQVWSIAGRVHRRVTEAMAAQRPDDQDGEPRHRPRAYGIRNTFARADWISWRVSDRNQRHRTTEYSLPPFRQVDGRDERPGHWLAGVGPHGRINHLRALQPAGAWQPLYSSEHEGL